MKLINKILKKFGYVHASKTQQDLDYVLHLFNIESLDELKIKSVAFAELVEILHKPNKLKIATLDTKKKMNDGEIPSLQDKIDEIMISQGIAGKFDELTKEERQRIFVEALNISDKIVD